MLMRIKIPFRGAVEDHKVPRVIYAALQHSQVLCALLVCLVLMPVPGYGQEAPRRLERDVEGSDARPAAAGDAPRVTKVMPLGASNTYGMYQVPTSPGGYRGPLYDLLITKGASFDFVGLDSDGAIPDPDHNGYPGKPIDWFTRPANETVREEAFDYSIHSGGQSAVQYFIE